MHSVLSAAGMMPAERQETVNAACVGGGFR